MMRLSFRTHRFLDTVKVYALAAVIVACMAVAVWLSWTTSMRRAETRGRASLVREAEQWIAASNSAWRVRMVESLAVAHRQRDTALVTHIVQSKAVAARVIAAADSMATTTEDSSAVVKDSLTAAPSVALRACGVQLDSLANACDRFRASATVLLAAKDSAIAALDADGKALSLMTRDAMTQLGKEQHARTRDRERHRVEKWVYGAIGAAVAWWAKP